MAASRRKGWESLSPAYQRRIERTIGRRGYESGKPLAKARGKQSSERESDLRKLNRYAKKDGLPVGNMGKLLDTYGSYAETLRHLQSRSGAYADRKAGMPDSPDIDYMQMSYLLYGRDGTIDKVWFYYNPR